MYELRVDDWHGFTKIYEALAAVGTRMQVPLRRFNQAYGRQFPEDAVIDLTIALELPIVGDEGRTAIPAVDARSSAACRLEESDENTAIAENNVRNP